MVWLKWASGRWTNAGTSWREDEEDPNWESGYWFESGDDHGYWYYVPGMPGVPTLTEEEREEEARGGGGGGKGKGKGKPKAKAKASNPRLSGGAAKASSSGGAASSGDRGGSAKAASQRSRSPAPPPPRVVDPTGLDVVPESRAHIIMIAAAKGWSRRKTEEFYGTHRRAGGDPNRPFLQRQADAKAVNPSSGAAKADSGAKPLLLPQRLLLRPLQLLPAPRQQLELQRAQPRRHPRRLPSSSRRRKEPPKVAHQTRARRPSQKEAVVPRQLK